MPVEPEFVVEYDFSQMVGTEPIDWDSLLNVGDIWSSFGGGWNDGAIDGESLT